MTDYNFNNIDVHELLPQQEPFVMIDRLVHCDTTSTTTRFTVREDNIFAEQGLLNGCALAENMAQTCAARLGFTNKYLLNRPIQLGFIGAIHGMVVNRCPRVGEILTTTIKVKEEIMGLTLVEATITTGGETIASGEMKIAVTDSEMK
ncbi:MAG: pseudouridylate synthase [Sodaliphilus pleomorphus]|jgi:predicted hotdog family 3-hydroxylacyl-ACP dehydratase|uniref:pseudouridylate synthase n=1 Tax=Sodaliphilus pleomorphus TaxID=2606626 RepID=UPI0023F3D840|nr:pseudouridylate synthase [Sodaliphilus pleomorphus]MDD6686967.1 pseudouridylate synthase [Sodaliphilus pleomorphus]MDD7065856.1 pseudouridylate synthase [Sodaliphilus pleomorphus]MDY2831681.1 pseudouridylate synthase [Sodaliphilus pleomorphus]MDY6252678.1 pseudouridylate synthase [Bacteroidales bacterium]